MIALIGKKNSGKTTLLTKIAAHNIKVINCDRLVNSWYKKNQLGFKLLVDQFGESIINANQLSIDKFKLSLLIKNDINNLKIVNSLIHPLIIAHLKKLKHEHYVIEISAISQEIGLVFNELFNGVIELKPNAFITKMHQLKKSKTKYYNMRKLWKNLAIENLENQKNIQFQKILILKNSKISSVNKALRFIKSLATKKTDLKYVK